MSFFESVVATTKELFTGKKEQDAIQDVFKELPGLEYERVIRWFNAFDTSNRVKKDDKAFKENVFHMVKSLQSQITNIESDKAASIFYIYFKLHSYARLQILDVSLKQERNMLEDMAPSLFDDYLFSPQDFSQLIYRSEFLEAAKLYKYDCLNPDRITYAVMTDMIIRAINGDLLKDLDNMVKDVLAKGRPNDIFGVWQRLFVLPDIRERALNIVLRCFSQVSMMDASTIAKFVVEWKFLDDGRTLDEKIFTKLIPLTVKKLADIPEWYRITGVLKDKNPRLGEATMEQLLTHIVKTFESQSFDEYAEFLLAADMNILHNVLLSLLKDKTETVLKYSGGKRMSEFYRESPAMEQAFLNSIKNMLQSKTPLQLNMIKSLLRRTAIAHTKLPQAELDEVLNAISSYLSLAHLLRLAMEPYLTASYQVAPNIIANYRDKPTKRTFSVQDYGEIRDVELKAAKTSSGIPVLYLTLCEELEASMNGQDTVLIVGIAKTELLCLPLLKLVGVRVKKINTMYETNPRSIQNVAATEWKAIHQFIQVYQKETAEHLKSDLLTAELQLLQDRFHMRKASLETGSFSLFDIDFAEKFTDILNVFFPSKITRENLMQSRMDLENAMTDLRTAEEGYNWLVKNGGAVARTAEELLQNDNMTLKKAASDLEEVVKVSKMPKPLLLHIGRMASTILYKEIVMCVRNLSFEKLKVLSQKDWEACIKSADNMLRTMFKRSILLSDPLFTPVAAIILKFKRTLGADAFSSEVKKLKELCKLHEVMSDMDNTELQAWLQELDAANRLLEFQSKIFAIQAYFIDKWKIHIQRTDNNNADFNVSLQDAQTQLKQIELESCMKMFHMDYFLVAQKCEPLLEFLVSFPTRHDFETKTNALNSNTQLDDFESNLLNTAEKAYEISTPLIQLIQQASAEGQVKKSLPDLGKQLTPLLGDSQEAMITRLQVVEEAMESLDDIKGKYSQMDVGLEGMIPQIKTVLEGGVFQSLTSAHAKGSHWQVSCRDGKITKDSYALQDLVSGCIFLNTTIATPEQQQLLSTFRTATAEMKIIHELHLRLIEIGHPEHNSTNEFSVAYTQDNILYALEMTKKKLNGLLEEWNEMLDHFKEPRLQLLKRMQLGRVLAELKQELKENNLRYSSIQVVMATIAFCCFPEQSFVDDTSLPSITAFCNQFKQANAKPQEDKFLVEWVQHLASKLKDQQPKNIVPAIISPRDSSRDYLFKLLHTTMYVQDCLIHPSLILFCDDENLSREDLSRFLTSCESFDHLPFALVGVDCLSAAHKEMLHKWLVKIFSENKQTQIGQLILVLNSTETEGADLFSFAEKQPGPDPATLVTHKLKLNSTISQLSFVMGEACSGKTMYIRQQIQNDPQKLCIAVKEDFSLQTVADAIANFPQPAISLHFAVSCYADFRQFSRFIINFVINGFIGDFSSGLIRSIPTTKQIKVLIELNGPSPDDASFTNVPPTSDVFLKAAIPMIRNLGMTLDHRQGVFQMSSHESDMIAFATQWLDKPHPDGYFAGVEARHGIVFNNHRKKSFLQLLVKRMEWLRIYENYISVMGTQGITADLEPKELYQYLEKECAILSDPDLGKIVSSRSPPILSSRLVQYVEDEGARGGGYQAASISFFNWKPPQDPTPLDGHTLFLHRQCIEKNRIYDKHIATRSDNSVDIMPKLRGMLAGVFGIESGKMQRILEQQQYVLTPDFAMRLILLHEKMEAHHSLILDGGTGVGKTEMLSFFAVLLNTAIGEIPDIMEEISKTIKSSFPEDFDLPREFRSIDLKNALNFLCDLTHAVTPVTAPNAPPAEPVQQPVYPQVGKLLLDLAVGILKRYSLIKLTPMLAAVQQGTFKLDTKESVLGLIEELVDIRFDSLFHRRLMHQRFSIPAWKIFFNKVFTLAAKYPQHKFVIFIDEVNTGTDSMGLIKEIFVDGTIDGKPGIPSNLFFVAAENPYMEESGNYINYNGLEDMVNTKPFIVRKTNLSLKNYSMNFGSFTKDHNEAFLEVYFDMKVGSKEFPATEEECNQFKKFIIASLSFLEHAHTGKQGSEYFSHKPDCNHTRGASEQLRIHASIRDVMRAITLYNTFRNEKYLSVLDYEAFPSGGQQRRYWHWTAVVMAIAMSCYSRVDPNNQCASRKAFAGYMDTLLKQHKAPYLIPALSASSEGTSFEATFKHVVKSFCKKKLKIPPGIALTDELMENVFFIMVCVEVKIPIQIVGPPGCSKTLSMSIALENASSKKTPFASMMETRYQCNPHSTDLEIKNVFKRARNRQRKNPFKRSVVFFDEGGLPKEEEAALKVIHKPLDHPEVSCVILTNNVLDAAKSNRTLLLLHTAIHTVSSTQNDSAGKLKRLEQLIHGCLFNHQDIDQSRSIKQQNIAKALARAFLRVNEFSHGTKTGLFNQRDHVYFLRRLKKRSKDGTEITPSALLQSLQRNYGGIDHASFVQLSQMFFEELKEYAVPPEVHEDVTVSCIRASVEEKIEENEDPNISAFRFVMVIDPTDNESSVTLLKELGICSEVIRVGSFAEDRESEAMNDVLSRMKMAITQGSTVLLVNSAELDACFYDVLNRYFKVVTNAKTGARELMAQVGVGSHSCATIVHPNFKVIVHVPKSKLGSIPLPYLNRFEKYILSYQQALDDYVQNKLPQYLPAFDHFKRELSNFTSTLHFRQQNKLLYGLIEQQTELSLLLTCAKATYAKQALTVPQALRFKYDEVPDDLPDEEKYPRIARLLNFHLLQLASPSAVFLTRALPHDYAQEYLLNREHFSVVNFLKLLLQRKDLESKWIVYTRTSSVLAGMHQGSESMNTLAEHVELDARDIKIIQLNTFTSDYACIEHLGTVRKEQLVLVIADMSNCTQSQVTLVRNYASVHFGEGITFALIVHYPPEMNMDSSPCYDAIFTEKFDCIYIDDIGITADGRQTNTTVDQDPKTWVAQAFGLQVQNLDKRSLEKGFEQIYFDAVDKALQACNAVHFIRNPPEARKFYSDKRARIGLVKELLNRHPKWKTESLRNFRKIWQESTMYELIRNISKAILAGTVVGSLLDVLRMSVKKILFQVATPLVKLVYCYGAFQTLWPLEPDSDGAKFVKLMIRTTAEHVNIHQIARNQKQDVINFNLASSKTAQAVLFDVVTQRLQGLLTWALTLHPNRDYVQIRTALDEILNQKDPLFAKALRFLESTSLRDDYAKEFVSSHLLRLKLQDGPWMSLMLRAVEAVDIVQNDSLVIKLHLIKFFFATHFRYLFNTCAPLQALDPQPDTSDWNPPRIFSEDSVNEIGAFGLETTLQQLWTRLMETCNTPDQISNWCRVYHKLKNRIPVRSLITVSAQKSKLQFSMLQVVYSFFTVCAPHPDKLGELLPRLREAVYEIGNQIGHEFSIHDLLHLAVQCLSIGKENLMGASKPESEKANAGEQHQIISLFVEEIFDAFLLSMDSCLQLFLIICNGTQRRHLDTILNGQYLLELCDALHPTWCIRTLKSLIGQHGRFQEVVELSERIVDLAEFFPPTVSDGIGDDLKKRLVQILPELRLPDKPNAPLADMLYYSFLAILESENNPINSFQQWKDLHNKDRTGKIDAVYQAALATFVLRKCAADWKEPKFQATAKQFTEDILRSDKGCWKLMFLKSLNDTTLMELVKDVPLLHQLGLAAWNTNNTVEHLALFPFVTSPNHPDHALWKKIKTAFEISNQKELDDAINASNTTKHINFVKTCIILLCYQNFSAGNATPIIEGQLAALQQKLNIPNEQMSAFKFLSSAPPQHTAQMDQLARYFSYSNPPLTEHKSVFPKVMVNCLAVAVSSPNSHLYNLIFKPETTLGQAIPGSGLDNRTLMDCAFKDQDTAGAMINSDATAPPFGNNSLYRYVVASSVWMGLSWSLLLHPNLAQLSQTMTTQGHFLNYWQQDGLSFGNQDKTTPTLVRHSVLMRALNLFQRAQLVDQAASQQIDIAHYMTAMLCQLWEHCNRDNPSPTLRCQFRDKAEVVAYEKYVSDAVLGPLTNDYQNIKKTLLDDLSAAGTLKSLLEYRSSQSDFFASPFLPIEPCHTWIVDSFPIEEINPLNAQGQEKSKREKWKESNGLKTPLRFFGDNMNLITLSSHVHSLINFYSSFLKLFAYRLHKEETLKLRVPDCIEKLRTEKLETEDVIANFESLWDQTKLKWAEFSDKMVELGADCNLQDANEVDLGQLTNETLVTYMIFQEQNEPGMIYRGVRRWLDFVQNCAQDKCDTENVNWVMKALLKKPDLASETFSEMLMDFANTGNFNSMLVASSTTAPDIEDLLLKQFCSVDGLRSRTNYVCHSAKLQYQLFERFLAGRYVADISNGDEDVKFKFKEASIVLPTTMIQESTDVLFAIRAFQQLVNQVESKEQFNKPLPSPDVSFLIASSDQKQKSLLQMTEVLEQLVAVVLQSPPNDMEALSQRTIGEIFQTRNIINIPSLLQKQAVTELPMGCLAKLCHLVLDPLLEGAHLYRKHGAAGTLGAAQAPLKALGEQLQKYSMDGQRIWNLALQHLLKVLKDRDAAKILMKKPDEDIYAVMHKDIDAATDHIRDQINKNMLSCPDGEAFDIKLIFPPKLKCRAFNPFMRFLHKTCTELFFSLQRQFQFSNEDTYQELPYGQSSFRLPGSEPVLPPGSPEAPQEDSLIDSIPISQAPELTDSLLQQTAPVQERRIIAAALMPFRGIVNLAQTCFMNSILQCLRAAKPFREALNQLSIQEDTAPVTSELRKILESVSKSHTEPVSSKAANRMFDAVTSRTALLRNDIWIQQDAYQFLTELLHLVGKELAEQNISMVKDLFQFQLDQTTVCQTCDAHSLCLGMTEKVIEISLKSQPMEVSLEHLLSCYFANTVDEYKCRENHVTVAIAKRLVRKPSPVLVIRIERGDNFALSDKMENVVSIPQKLDLTPYSTDPVQYHLSSVVVHYSDTIHAGHFVADVLEDGKWYNCDDTRINEYDNPAKERNCYILFYVLQPNAIEPEPVSPKREEHLKDTKTAPNHQEPPQTEQPASVPQQAPVSTVPPTSTQPEPTQSEHLPVPSPTQQDLLLQIAMHMAQQMIQQSAQSPASSPRQSMISTSTEGTTSSPTVSSTPTQQQQVSPYTPFTSSQLGASVSPSSSILTSSSQSLEMHVFKSDLDNNKMIWLLKFSVSTSKTIAEVLEMAKPALKRRKIEPTDMYLAEITNQQLWNEKTIDSSEFADVLDVDSNEPLSKAVELHPNARLGVIVLV